MSSFSFSRKVAARYLWSKRSEAFITIITVISILGVAIGVMVLNIVMSVMTGFEHELREKIVGTNAHITVRALGGKITDWRKVQEQIRSVSDVNSVAAFTYNQALIRAPSSSVGLLVRGIEAGSPAAAQLGQFMERQQSVDQLFQPPSIEVARMDGTSELIDLPGVVIGRELARSLTLFRGQPVSLLSPNTTSTPFGLVPQYKRFVVAGTYSSGLVEYESGLAYIDLKEAQRFFRLGDSVSGFEVRIKDVDSAPLVAQRIKDALDKIGPGFMAQPWTEQNRALWEAIQLEKRAYFIVLLLIIVMASFSIVATLIMIVLEKRKDIAVLMTLGASSRSIGNIFRIQGAVVGALGTVLGLVLGILGCLALREYGFPLNEQVFQMKELPVKMEATNFALVGISAFLICCLSTIYPAHRASRLGPAEVLRYE